MGGSTPEGSSERVNNNAWGGCCIDGREGGGGVVANEVLSSLCGRLIDVCV